MSTARLGYSLRVLAAESSVVLLLAPVVLTIDRRAIGIVK